MRGSRVPSAALTTSYHLFSVTSRSNQIHTLYIANWSDLLVPAGILNNDLFDLYPNFVVTRIRIYLQPSEPCATINAPYYYYYYHPMSNPCLPVTSTILFSPTVMTEKLLFPLCAACVEQEMPKRPIREMRGMCAHGRTANPDWNMV